MPLENSMGTTIRDFREERGLSQAQVVDRLSQINIHMSRETLSKIENNNRTISAVELNAICHVLDIDINALFGERESEDDLVALFRKKGDFSEKTIEQIENLQDMIKIFINQEKIYKGEYKDKTTKPLWEECLN